MSHGLKAVGINDNEILPDSSYKNHRVDRSGKSHPWDPSHLKNTVNMMGEFL